MRRWLPVLVGALAVVLLAAGTGYGIDRAFQPESGGPVQLKTVPATTLAQLGLTAATARAPAYCDLVNAAAERQVGGPGAVGCPISRHRAEATAQGGAAGRTVREAVLARVTGVQQSQIGSGHLSWILILQAATPFPMYTRGTTAMACPALAAPGQPGGQPIPLRCGQVTALSELVLIDAQTAGVLMTAPVGFPVRRVPPPPRTLPVGQSVPVRGAPSTVAERAVSS